MKISFHGAARTVTGSKHLLTLENGTKILMDCGLFQGLGFKTAELNESFGFDPASINFLLLSHAHIDHSGLVPKLVRDGFTGKIFCTPATLELAEILLYDSAEIQVSETNYLNKIRNGHSLEPYEPLYTPEDVQASLLLFETVGYDTVFKITDEVEVVFTDAGHLVGSASMHLTVHENNKKTTIAFSGDVGRYRSTLLQSPAPFAQADYIILESTYGGSMHELGGNSIDPLLNCIKRTCIDKQGKLIIPAFSVGRTQEVLYALNQLELEKRLPALNYFVDSPLSKKATGVIKNHMENFNERLQKVLATDEDPFDFEGLKYVESVEDSQKLEALKEPCVIISASGTADAGRVRHHIYNSITTPENTILFVGYCQEQSLGGQLLNGKKNVEIFGEDCAVAADVNSLATMSAHGDRDDLLRYLSCQDATRVKNIFLVHGEYATQEAFATRLSLKEFSTITIPAQHQEFELE
jgi:metallo-beta-lactamase family protein